MAVAGLRPHRRTPPPRRLCLERVVSNPRRASLEGGPGDIGSSVTTCGGQRRACQVNAVRTAWSLSRRPSTKKGVAPPWSPGPARRLSAEVFAASPGLPDAGRGGGQSFRGAEGSRAIIWRDRASADLSGPVSGAPSLYMLNAEGINGRRRDRRTGVRVQQWRPPTGGFFWRLLGTGRPRTSQ